MILKLISSDGKDIYVNMDKVFYFDKGYENGFHTTNLRMGNYSINVKEMPEDIFKMLTGLKIDKGINEK